MSQYTTDNLVHLFFMAVDLFNNVMKSDIGANNVQLAFFTPDNGLFVYEEFCSLYFPAHLKENYRAEGYFESFAAQAFVGDGVYGVMIRSDLDDSMGDPLEIFLHEISHIYCVRHEYNGKNFFETHCMGSGPDIGIMDAGYIVWREAIADIMVNSVITDYCTTSLPEARLAINESYQQLSITNPDSKWYMSRIIAHIMLSKEVAGTEIWDEAEAAIVKNFSFDCEIIYALLHQVFDNLHRAPYWTITPGFISMLGETYLSIITHRDLRKILLQ